MAFNKKGFTLIEVMVVVVILGILASIAVLSVQRYIKRAIKSEAITAMGVLRTAERAYYMEYGSYQPLANPPNTLRLNQFQNIGLTMSGLDGTYFSNNCYSTVTTDPSLLSVWSDFSGPPAPLANRVNTEAIWMWMNMINGEIGGNWR